MRRHAAVPSEGVLPEAAPLRCAAQRLVLVRVVAWALLLGGWLVLGALGRQHGPQFAAGQWPVALWLVVIGGLLAAAARRSGSAPVLRVMVLASGAAGALALMLWGDTVAGVLVAAVAWAALLVCASFTVRRLRLLQRHAPPDPVACAVLGAVLAWSLAGDLDAVRQNAAPVGLALGAAALLLSALVPSLGRATASRSCRAGLFDCSLPLRLPGRWREPAAWPQAAAALGMLPMMASLPLMTEWCGELRLSSATGTALHLGVMLLPAALWRAGRLDARTGRRADARSGARAKVGAGVLAGALLVLGGAALAWPGLSVLSGLMGASLLHGLAWSVAWAAMLGPPDRTRTEIPTQARTGARTEALTETPTPRHAAVLGPALLTAAAVLLLGVAIDQRGPAALASVHAALAGLGLLGLLAALAALAARQRLPRLTHAHAHPHPDPEAPR